MKNHLPYLLALGLTLMVDPASAQKLSLVGSNFSFAKGNVDMEVLPQIIEAKQVEVLEKVFRDQIINNLQNQSGTKKSFATYSYIYNIAQTITLEKNKTVITRQVVNNLLEYCLVYGFTRQFIASLPTTPSGVAGASLVMQLETVPTTTRADEKDEAVFLKDLDQDEWKSLNIYLDMAYDIFLQDEEMHNRGLFKLLIDQPTLRRWYERDNAYLHLSPAQKTLYDDIRNQMLSQYAEIKKNNLIVGLTDIKAIYKALEPTEFKQETITENQYKAIKSTLRLAIKALKTYSDNNLIGNISSFLLDYTLVEFEPAPATNGLGPQTNIEPVNAATVSVNSSTGNNGTTTGATPGSAKNATASTEARRGILYIDAEGLVSALYDKFAANEKRSTVARKFGYLIPRPFFVIGTTYSGALRNNNQLLVSDAGTSNLRNIYFAGEKIGVRFTAFDRKYTHAFEPGEEFRYRGRKTYWIEPQKQPTISRTEIFLYGSGLLYNLVDIKSQENFNYTLAGASVGVTFFNGLLLTTGLALPVNARGNLSNKYLYTLSFDVPIIEYIAAVRKKRSK